MTIKFDPRTKIILIIISAVALSLEYGLVIEMVITGIFILPFFLSYEWKWGIIFTIIYTVQLLVAYFLIPHISSAFILFALSLLTNGFRRMLPSIIAGAYAIKTTTLAEWVATFKKWRIPRAFSIPFTVMARFFPTVREDYRQIRNSMALRGIATGNFAFIKHPIQTFEHILIPLLMNASQVAQDLTISSLTKGLGYEGKQTSIVQLDFRLIDWLMIILTLLPIIYYLGGLIW